ncbi:MAG: homocysteine S-methyltransferase family protein [Oscillospiraceae bacterium]|nr:homocysteine S-methyltransferase family protein [Oscillospiraceae bacterium]
MKFIELLKLNKIIFADGAQGTELRRLLASAGCDAVESPHLLNFSNPEIVAQVARSYADAGSDFVCANTFSINRFNVADVDAEIKQALAVTKEALAGTGALTALDVTTLGQLLEPAGTLTFEQAYDIYREIMIAGEKHGADLVIIETMTDLYETKAALLALKENTNLPVICSMTFEQNGRTFTGTPVPCMAATLEGLGADVLGINCSLGPAELSSLVRELLSCTNLPVMVKPNAGLPDPETGEFKLSAEEFADAMSALADAAPGISPIKIMGGCCGTTPEFIKELRKREINYQLSIVNCQLPVLCGYSGAVDISRPRIIGERINPTGKKLMKQALLAGDMGYILKQAAEQLSAGADILDVNVGAAGIDEVTMLPKVVKAVQGITGIPLQLDSANPAALEAALRVTNGKPIVNSVNAENESLDAVLPLVKKYGAAVVGLTLDKAGIPKKAEQRLVLAEKILNHALRLGIKREDVFIDCLTLTAGAEQEGAAETLKAVRLVKEKLGLITVLGVSNISFGLPERGVINRTFLALALQSGLDLPIMNPNEKEMRDTVRAFSVLSGYDKNAAEYVASAAGVEKPAQTADITLEYAILNGLKTEAAGITKKLLADTPPLEIINMQLIPALDKTGALFESGKIFLPQLMLSAETASACFEILKTAFGDNEARNDNKIILATVKGDIHDIGKNIVRTLLESYGYNVIDLGRDVESSVILEEVRRQNVKLVGLSALMTPTLPAMEQTARLIKSSTDCRIMVGGAVVTEDWAKKAGADFYGKDAKSAVDIAGKIFHITN